MQVLGAIEVPEADLIQVIAPRLDDPQTRLEWMLELSALQRAVGPFLPRLRGWLRSSDPEERAQAAKALGRLGSHAAPALDDLIAALADSDPFVREAVATALGEIQHEPAKVVDALVHSLDDPRLRVARAAIESLGRYSDQASTVVPALLRAIDRREVATEAIWALEKWGPAAAPAVDRCALVLANYRPRGLHDRDLVAAIVCLGRIGPKAKSAIPALERIQFADSHSTQRAVRRAIIQIMLSDAQKQ